MDHDWMLNDSGDFIDIHRELMPFSDVLEFFIRIEREFDVLQYCNGSNAGGRWIYQIYNTEFIYQISDIISRIVISTSDNNPILEVMSGDGKLSEFLHAITNYPIYTTDSKTSRDNIEYPKWVETLDALDAIDHYSPSIILMSWEPFYSDTGIRIIETGIPTLWIGDPSRSSVGTGLGAKYHTIIPSDVALGRTDLFSERIHKTEIRLYNYKSLNRQHY
ncbi:MAG: hypothetical protein ACFFF4_00215 [Candidatus Thorarchaeota archaeon]